jgi:hypothetical protein
VNKLKTYTCVVEYFATGEGFHVYLGVVKATSRQEAIKSFRNHFKFFDKPRCWNYFKIGLEVTNGINRYKLSNYLSHRLISHIKQHMAFEDVFMELNFGSTIF